jgi:hypothetical protein
VFSSLKIAGMIGVALMVGTIAGLWRVNGKLHEEIGKYRSEIVQATSVNRENVAEIDAITKQNNQCVESIRVDKERNVKTVSDLYVELEQLRARKPAIVREEIYRDPSCAQLGSIDIAAVCPALADGVRKRAGALGARGDPRGGGGGANTAAGRVF